jgi:hypothetical protein
VVTEPAGEKREGEMGPAALDEAMPVARAVMHASCSAIVGTHFPLTYAHRARAAGLLAGCPHDHRAQRWLRVPSARGREDDGRIETMPAWVGPARASPAWVPAVIPTDQPCASAWLLW